MKTTNALMAAALAGVFAAGTAASHAVSFRAAPVSADAEKEKDKCPGKDGSKDKKEKEDKLTLSATTEADKEKSKCSGKDGCKGKEKEKKSEIL